MGTLSSGVLPPPFNQTLLPSNSSALWGFQLADEPAGQPQFTLLARWRRAIEAVRPDLLNFVNLLPNYGMDPHQGWVGDSAYQDYMDAYIATYSPAVLCFDHYPWFEVGDSPPYSPPTFVYPNNTRDGYRANLVAIRTAALRYCTTLQSNV